MAESLGLDAPRWLRVSLVLAAVAAMGLLVLLPLAVVLGSGFAKGLHAWATAIAVAPA
jgi:ABC-type sulfate transport system permease subunit